MFKNVDSSIRDPEFKSYLFNFTEGVSLGKVLILPIFHFLLLQNGNHNGTSWVDGKIK